MKKIALITGASSGIGLSIARKLADDYSLIICGRRKERILDLQSELSKKTDVHPLLFDVRSRKQVENAIQSLPSDWQKISVLINNAGNAHGLAPVDSGNVDDWDAMIDGNVKGLLYVSRSIIPGMVERKEGHIINIGSLAGKEVYPNGNVYCASKHAVDALSQGMRIDLNPHGIKVSAINPGLVETEFSKVRFKGDEDKASRVYAGYQPLTADDVADVIHFVLTRPNHVNIADLLLLPSDQATSTIVNKKP